MSISFPHIIGLEFSNSEDGAGYFFIIRMKWPVLSSGEKIHRKKYHLSVVCWFACRTLKINHYSYISIGDDLIYSATYVTTILCYILISKLIILKLIAFRNFWCILIKQKSSTTELEEKVRLISNFFLLQYTFFYECFVYNAQQAHDAFTTSPQRRCNVMTLHRRWCDVV